MSAHRPPGDVTMTADRKCTLCDRAMKRTGPFWDCERCGRTVHDHEVDSVSPTEQTAHQVLTDVWQCGGCGHIFDGRDEVHEAHACGVGS